MKLLRNLAKLLGLMAVVVMCSVELDPMVGLKIFLGFYGTLIGLLVLAAYCIHIEQKEAEIEEIEEEEDNFIINYLNDVKVK